ncbi:hypothetical protein LOK49_LG07G01100 [Camellia lanceoleosa]|uniref:Uncharacterized protein n=1 Tax=Camellia lanceoleosa TaxID=1840588 RepID=A0ACC0H2X0_9ERIC|nr:hypothetical protein LOK49_LG07G01100 [Camellia lanceoleosa]
MVLLPPGKGHRPRYCYPRARAIRTKGATNTFQKNWTFIHSFPTYHSFSKNQSFRIIVY